MYALLQTPSSRLLVSALAVFATAFRPMFPKIPSFCQGDFPPARATGFGYCTDPEPKGGAGFCVPGSQRTFSSLGLRPSRWYIRRHYVTLDSCTVIAGRAASPDLSRANRSQPQSDYLPSVMVVPVHKKVGWGGARLGRPGVEVLASWLSPASLFSYHYLRPEKYVVSGLSRY